MSAEYIYALINPAMSGLVKVGKTTRAPEERAKELSSATGVATPFILAYQRKVADCHAAEAQVHSQLEALGYRYAKNREFFEAPLDVIVGIMNDLILDEETTEPLQNEVVDTLYEDGMRYLNGDETTFANRSKGISLLEKSASLGNPMASLMLGCLYLVEDSEYEDRPQALAYFDEIMRWDNPRCFPIIFHSLLEAEMHKEALVCWNRFLEGIEIRLNDITSNTIMVMRYEAVISDFYKQFSDANLSYEAAFSGGAQQIIDTFRISVDTRKHDTDLHRAHEAYLNQNLGLAVELYKKSLDSGESYAWLCLSYIFGLDSSDDLYDETLALDCARKASVDWWVARPRLLASAATIAEVDSGNEEAQLKEVLAAKLRLESELDLCLESFNEDYEWIQLKTSSFTAGIGLLGKDVYIDVVGLKYDAFTLAIERGNLCILLAILSEIDNELYWSKAEYTLVNFEEFFKSLAIENAAIKDAISKTEESDSNKLFGLLLDLQKINEQLIEYIASILQTASPPKEDADASDKNYLGVPSKESTSEFHEALLGARFHSWMHPTSTNGLALRNVVLAVVVGGGLGLLIAITAAN